MEVHQVEPVDRSLLMDLQDASVAVVEMPFRVRGSCSYRNGRKNEELQKKLIGIYTEKKEVNRRPISRQTAG